jgi:hypothetical protein
MATERKIKQEGRGPAILHKPSIYIYIKLYRCIYIWVPWGAPAPQAYIYIYIKLASVLENSLAELGWDGKQLGRWSAAMRCDGQIVARE